MYKFLYLVCFILVAKTYAVPVSLPFCEDLLPDHEGNITSPNPSPYAIKVNTTTVGKGGLVEVTIEAADKKPFRGFFIQAREKIDVYKTFGTFRLKAGEKELITAPCQEKDDSIGHSTNDDKKIASFYYVPRAGYKGKVIITGTIVENYKIWYAKVSSPAITVDTL